MKGLRRMACVVLAELPLQLLLREHPEYRGQPVAVVEADRPDAYLLWINREARELCLRRGMRFGAARSLVPTLAAGAISALVIERAVAMLVEDLQAFSPHVERDPVYAGVFYVDPSGLSHLYGGELNWARSVHRYLGARRLWASVVVAHGRMLAYALARAGRGVRALESAEESLRLARGVSLEALALEPKLRDALERLGLSTLGDLASFQADALGVRFGKSAERWCRVAQGEEVLSLAAEPHLSEVAAEVEIEPPDSDVDRVSFAIKRALDRLLEDVRQRGKSVRALLLELVLERPSAEPSAGSTQRLEPSTPTRDASLLLELLRLRLSALRLSSPLSGVRLAAELSDVAAGQLSMFAPRRDLAAGERAMARLQAHLGAEVSCFFALEEAHLPEASFRAHAAKRLARPRAPERDDAAWPEAAAEHGRLPLIRRLLPRPRAVVAQLIEREQTRFLRWCPPPERSAGEAEEELALLGPQRISGGWWVREATRDYYYGRSLRGDLYWLYFDQVREQWFLHGWVD